MTLASGIFKQLRYKAESAWGTPPGATGAQLLRRTTSSLDIVKDTYESAEMRSDFQVADFRHGSRRVEGSLNGELSPKTYGDFFAALLRKAAATGATTGAQTTISATTSPNTYTRSGGSFLTDGFKVGDVVRATGFTAAGNNNKNARITALTATIMTVDITLTVEAAGNSITIAATGKKIWVPSTGHTDQSFSIEHWFSDIAQSELFTGCKISSCDISLPVTGMSTVAFNVVGKGVTTSTSAYYTTPTAETVTELLTAVSGKLRIGSTDIATVTGATINIAGNFKPAPVVGSNEAAAVFPGRVRVNGQITAYFEDATLRDAFLNETDLALYLLLTTGSEANADFVNIVLPRIKPGGATKNDGEEGIVQTIPFVALLNTAGGSGINSELTTMSIQDSAL